MEKCGKCQSELFIGGVENFLKAGNFPNEKDVFFYASVKYCTKCNVLNVFDANTERDYGEKIIKLDEILYEKGR